MGGCGSPPSASPQQGGTLSEDPPEGATPAQRGCPAGAGGRACARRCHLALRGWCQPTGRSGFPDRETVPDGIFTPRTSAGWGLCPNPPRGGGGTHAPRRGAQRPLAGAVMKLGTPHAERGG